jgi:hypothetical protein
LNSLLEQGASPALQVYLDGADPPPLFVVPELLFELRIVTVQCVISENYTAAEQLDAAGKTLNDYRMSHSPCLRDEMAMLQSGLNTL